MSFTAEITFKCSGCKVVTALVQADNADDIVPPLPPSGWLLVDTYAVVNGEMKSGTSHYCPMCAPLITSYLAGRREGEEAADD